MVLNEAETEALSSNIMRTKQQQLNEWATLGKAATGLGKAAFSKNGLKFGLGAGATAGLMHGANSLFGSKSVKDTKTNIGKAYVLGEALLTALDNNVDLPAEPRAKAKKLVSEMLLTISDSATYAESMAENMEIDNQYGYDYDMYNPYSQYQQYNSMGNYNNGMMNMNMQGGLNMSM